MTKQLRERFFVDTHQRFMRAGYGSVLSNLLVGSGKLMLGIYFQSFWFLITACYYVALSLLRASILFVLKHEGKKMVDRQRHIVQRSGICIILLGFLYFLLCLWMYIFKERIQYPYYILFGVAALAFYKIGASLYGLYRYRIKYGSLYMLMKTISFLDACVSMVFTQYALLLFKHSQNAAESSALLGMVISVMFLIMGLRIIRKSKRAVG